MYDANTDNKDTLKTRESPPYHQTYHPLKTVGDAHRWVRDDFFRRLSDCMVGFEGKHPQIMALPFTPDNLRRLVEAEDKYVESNISLSNPGSLGNFIARIAVDPCRSLAAGILAGTYGASMNSLRGTFDADNPFQEQAKEYYMHSLELF